MVGADPKSMSWRSGYDAFVHRACPQDVRGGQCRDRATKSRPSSHHDRTFKSLQCSFRPSCGQTSPEPLWSVLHP